MRYYLPPLVGLALLLTLASPVGAEISPEIGPTVDLEFSGYRFGQSPAANMVCSSGFCKSQAPDGDGRVTFPFSVYRTPDAVTTLSGLTVVNPSYTFWEERLFRILFQVDCTPLETDECFDDIVETLDREYGLLPLSVNDIQDFPSGKRIVTKEFATDSGAFVKIRAAIFEDTTLMPFVDIADREMTNLVGSTLSPSFKPKKLNLQELQRRP